MDTFTEEQKNKADDLLAVDQIAFSVVCKRLAKPNMPISKIASDIGVTRQCVYRSIEFAIKFGFDVRTEEHRLNDTSTPTP